MISADDQLVDNQMIFEKTLREQGTYMLLSRRGKSKRTKSPSLSSQMEDSGKNYLIADIVYKEKGIIEQWLIRRMAVYHTNPSDSGIADRYDLFKVSKLATKEGIPQQRTDE